MTQLDLIFGSGLAIHAVTPNDSCDAPTLFSVHKRLLSKYTFLVYIIRQ